uniref:Reverse transcriptase Ty1/copia-type domain-containing protein n=1 Tax=Physcomitrium patens TaxID=3218 RepID=A0A2K1J2J7_PHYPA|nr:hypothetical protein PHYPA_021602 [Physcomitrium patens]
MNIGIENAKLVSTPLNDNYVRNLEKRRSTTNYLFMLVGGLISWKLTLQPYIGLSTKEVECISALVIIKDAIWLQILVRDLSLIYDRTMLYYNN